MRDRILGNFRRRLLGVLRTDDGLQHPSIIESLLRRRISIIHLEEQHISMDLAQGIREVLSTESFAGPISNLQMFEKPEDIQTGSAVEIIGNWYVENIVKDISGVGVVFMTTHNCFKSSQRIGGYSAESFTDVRELTAFLRIFGGYGFDKIAGMAGQAIAFLKLLVHAAGVVLEEKAPLIVSLLHAVVKQLPDEDEILRLRRVTNSIGVIGEHDTDWMHSIMMEAGAANDGSWSLLPYLFASFMMSGIWSTTTYNIKTGGFNNNVHCLAMCIRQQRNLRSSGPLEYSSSRKVKPGT
ncbi:putative protein NAP1 [Cocos nucifera]|uniref:Uncharacterized protein n=1 Tax=Cocos nucifera TaxID=13894 RepID=A0A8K0IVJ2_COCNU|nr:putative protein NAP1 [Cocos nucifera]